MKSTHAQAAAQIRKELKKHGIKATVRSESFSMGNAVRVSLTDVLPATLDKVREFAGQYQYGHFNGMEDIYEYSNDRNDLPQVKYVQVSCDYSDEMKAAALEHLKAKMAGFEEIEVNINNDYNKHINGEYVSTWVYRVLSGALDIGFWTNYKPRV